MRCVFSSEGCASEGSEDRACCDQVACASIGDCGGFACCSSEGGPPDLIVADLVLIASGRVFFRVLELEQDLG